MLQNTRRICASRLASLALLCVSCVAVALTHQSPARGASLPPLGTDYECEGGACSSVTLMWEEEGQRFRADNSSPRKVRVTVSTFAGDSWVVIEPQSSAYLGVKGFNGAYRAEFE